MNSYDSYYQTPNLFGDPYPELLAFFSQYPSKGKLLDFGCGQGRNAIPLARMGYEVTGIDVSQVGIEQMMQVSKAESLSLEGIVADIYTFDSLDQFDFILLDSMFHFGKREKEQELGLIRNIFSQTKEGALIIICIQDSGKKVQILKEEIQAFEGVEVQQETSFSYTFVDKESNHSSISPYRMLVLEKS